MQDKLFKVLLILSAIVIPVIGGGIIYSLTVDASGAFEEFGFWHFIFSDDWVTTAGKESYVRGEKRCVSKFGRSENI